MSLRIRYVFLLFLCFFLAWCGWATYTYFFDLQEPQLTINGLVEGQWCSGDVQCALLSSKKSEVSLYLDGKPLITKFKVIHKKEDYVFVIPTKTISNGVHELTIDCIDTTYNKNSSLQFIPNMDGFPNGRRLPA